VSAAYYTEDSLGEELFERGACQVGGGKAGVEGEGERGRAAGSESRKPFLDIHGDSDMVIAYDGDNSRFDVDQNGIPDPDTLPIPLWLGDWARRNGYPDSEIATMPHFLETGDIANSTVWLHNGTVERSSWTCAGWSDVVVGMKVRGLGHGWPSTVPLEGVYEEMRLGTSGWNASAVLMEWFGGWSLRLGNSL
jgi:poly(3-hydroxybutyrate) depolymerase